MLPLLKLFHPEKAEIHYRISSSILAGNRDLQEKFTEKKLAGLGYEKKKIASFYDEYFGRAFYHLNIEKK